MAGTVENVADRAASTAVNLLDPKLYIDPWETYRWLRDHDPCHWDPVNEIWGISRYHDIVDVEKRVAQYSSARGSRPHIESSESMINMDDPQHQNYRRLVARQFTPRAVKQVEDRVRLVATKLIDDIIDAGSCEVIDALAAPLPAIVIGDKLGFAPEQWTKCRDWSEITMYEAGQYPADGSKRPPGAGDRSMNAVMDFAGAVMELIVARRAEPRDDLISVWCHQPVEQLDGTQRLMNEGEIIQEALLLLDGGAETTRTVIGAIVYELIRHPDQRQLLIDDPTRIGSTGVEEFIRWVTPILNMKRTVTVEHERDGRRLKAGDEVLLMYPSANRDERVFDEPDRFDVLREHNHHVAFGFGSHFCLGASLARIEIKVMFEELLRRIPHMRLVPGTEPNIVPAVFTRAYDAVHVEF